MTVQSWKSTNHLEKFTNFDCDHIFGCWHHRAVTCVANVLDQHPASFFRTKHWALSYMQHVPPIGQHYSPSPYEHRKSVIFNIHETQPESLNSLSF